MDGSTVKRLGRPPEKEETRRELLRVRLTTQERATLEVAAARHGMDVSRYIRSVAIERDQLK